MRRLQLVLLCFGCSVVLRADTIYSNFGNPGSLYSPASGYGVGGTIASGGIFAQAFAFVPAVDYRLTEVDIAIEYESIGPNSALISLWNDSASAPGTILTSWALNNLPTFGTCCAFQSLLPNGQITVLAGQRYWIVAAANGNGSFLAWNDSNTGGLGFGTTSVNGGPFPSGGNGSPGAAFRVLGTPVPEPATQLLVVPIFLLLGAVRGRRQLSHLFDLR